MVVYGVDFGTTNSCISYYNKELNRVVVITNNDGLYTYPSVIYFNNDLSEILFGEVAKSGKNISNVISNIKRLIGINRSDLLKFFKNNNVKMSENGEVLFDVTYNDKVTPVSVKELTRHYLRYLRSIIELVNGKESIEIVITVPVYFNDFQRCILRENCELVGMSVLRIINEPTAAGLAYAFNESGKRSSEEYVLVFDCGGGTTDISLLELDYSESETLCEVKSTCGNNMLGGEDITYSIMEYIVNKFKIKETSKNMYKVRSVAELVKVNLSFNTNYKINLELGEELYTMVISREQLNDICSDIFKKIKNLIYYVLDSFICKSDSFSYNDINSVIFVGGSTRIPYFKKIFSEILPNLIINDTIDADKIVSIGASVQGGLMNELINENSVLLVDVLPMTIGVETMGGIMSSIISKNNIIPVIKEKRFTNSESYDDTIIIKLYQGERRFVKDNIYMGEVELKCESFKKYSAGEINITLKFSINSDSIMSISARASVKNVELVTSDKCIKVDFRKVESSESIMDELKKIKDLRAI